MIQANSHKDVWHRRILSQLVCILTVSLSACLPISNNPVPGPDKQAIGTWYGAAAGAASGAVSGLNYTSVAGPGAWVGAGLGGIFGLFSGMGQDQLEEEQLRRKEQLEKMRQILWVQNVLTEHYQKRLELHPGRDIYPADLFFQNDEVVMKQGSVPLMRGIAWLAKQTKPWSRIVVGSYVNTRDESSAYANYLAKQRAEKIALTMVRFGIDARRIETRPLTLSSPILVDPLDSPTRYAQAIELIYID